MSAGHAPGAMAQDKRELRARTLALRKSVSAQTREALAESLIAHGLALARRQAAGAVSLFWPIRGEPDTLPLLTRLAGAGVATCLPVTGARGAPLVFRQWRPGDPQVEGPMRIPEPAPHLPIVEPDLLFVPLAAFDRRGGRIGYGAGYYDLTLRRLRARKPIVAVGVAFAVQEVAATPAEAHDERLDFVLTESGPIACRE